MLLNSSSEGVTVYSFIHSANMYMYRKRHWPCVSSQATTTWWQGPAIKGFSVIPYPAIASGITINIFDSFYHRHIAESWNVAKWTGGSYTCKQSFKIWCGKYYSFRATQSETQAQKFWGVGIKKTSSPSSGEIWTVNSQVIRRLDAAIHRFTNKFASLQFSNKAYLDNVSLNTLFK